VQEKGKSETEKPVWGWTETDSRDKVKYIKRNDQLFAERVMWTNEREFRAPPPDDMIRETHRVHSTSALQVGN